MDFSTKLREILAQCQSSPVNFTQETLAFVLGVSRSHIASLLNGRRQPSRALQKRLRDKFTINPDWWDTGKGEIFLDDEVIFELDQEYLRHQTQREGFLPETIAIAEACEELLGEISQRDRSKITAKILEFVEGIKPRSSMDSPGI